MDKNKLITYGLVAALIGGILIVKFFYEKNARENWDQVTARIENPRVDYKKTGSYDNRKSRRTCFYDLVYTYKNQTFKQIEDKEVDNCQSQNGKNVQIYVNPENPKRYVQ